MILRPKETYDGALPSGNSILAYDFVKLYGITENEQRKGLSCKIPLDVTIRVLDTPTKEYPRKEDKLTFYICKGRSCFPPVNDLADFWDELP